MIDELQVPDEEASVVTEVKVRPLDRESRGPLAGKRWIPDEGSDGSPP